jgi:hypothetical protein
MNCQRPTIRFGQRRFVEVWRSGRPDLLEHQTGFFAQRRHFDQPPQDAGLKFQVFSPELVVKVL